MQTKDHRLLGSFLLRQQDIFLDPMRKSLFLLGCVEPDLNPVTYTRGSLHHRFLHGHNAENAGKRLARLTQKLHKSGVQSPLVRCCHPLSGGQLYLCPQQYLFRQSEAAPQL